jgi:hypothetical protein
MKGFMKTLFAYTAVLVVTVAAALAIVGHSRRPSPLAPDPAPGNPVNRTEETISVSQVQPQKPEPNPERSTTPQASSVPSPVPQRTVLEPSWTPDQAIHILVSSETTYAQKQAAWKRLRDPEQLDKAIAELEERAKNDPQIAGYSAVLGTAYLHRAGLTKDIREQAILGMKADQTFDAALNTDPNNWEARYMKAVGMSYWPAQMNKGLEVLQRFTLLIQDQEQLPAQPEFSQTYLHLGDEYRKAGQLENAQQVWQRGAALFPDDSELKRKLASIQ